MLGFRSSEELLMSTATLIIGSVAILIILATAALFLATRQSGNNRLRSGQLRERFGSEYERTLAEKGDARTAERELLARQKRVSSFHIATLDAAQGRKFS